jgi:hypothetical protein
MFALQRRAQPAHPALVKAQPVCHLLLGHLAGGEQFDQQDALGHRQRRSGKVADGRVAMHGEQPHHLGEQAFQQLGVGVRHDTSMVDTSNCCD